MLSKELLSALAGAIVLEVGKQTVGIAGCKLGEYCYSHVAKGGKSIFGQLKDECQVFCQDIIEVVSPRKAEEGRATLRSRWKREAKDQQAVKEEIAWITQRKLAEGGSRSLDHDHGLRPPHRTSPEPQLRSAGGHAGQPHHARPPSSNDARLPGCHERRRSDDDRCRPRYSTLRPATKPGPRNHHDTLRGHSIPQHHDGFSSALQRAVDTTRASETLTSRLYYLSVEDIREVLRIEQRTLDAQAMFAEDSRKDARVRDNRAHIERIDESSTYFEWKHADDSCILVVNGNDADYRNEPINIFSHTIEEKYVFFKNQPRTDAIPCYVGCWQDFVDAKGPVESMMRSLCWQLIKFPITIAPTYSNPAVLMNALRQFDLDALCALFKQLCLSHSHLNPGGEQKRLVILIEGGSIFEMQYDDPQGNYETFKRVMNAMYAAVVNLRKMADPVVLKILLVFPGKSSNVPAQDGVVSVLTLPRTSDGESEGEIRVPRW